MKNIKYYSRDITFSENPLHISLSYGIVGCPLNCQECHSKILEKTLPLVELNEAELRKDLDTYRDDISNVCFLGGEWQEEKLIALLKIVKSYGICTTLYTGYNEISDEIIKHLDYIKYGPYIVARGGLDNEGTNQTFIEVATNKDLTHLFKKRKI